MVGFGATNAEAVAATLVYRFATVVPTLVIGLVAAATFRVGQPRQAGSIAENAQEPSSTSGLGR